MKIKDGRITITSKIAYIAGFFDGEGCIRIKQNSQRGNSFSVIAHITNTNLEILQQVQDLFGGQVRKQERGVNKTIFNWYITSAEAIDFLRTLSPFLQEKLAQANLAFDFDKRKHESTLKEKQNYAKTMSALKKEVIGNIWENPELLKGEKE